MFTGGISSYSLLLMIASFLKIHPKIQSGEIEAENNMGVLLIEFFELVKYLFNINSTGNSLIMNGTGSLFLIQTGHSISIKDIGGFSTRESLKIYVYRIHMMNVIINL